jgi:hypothetical protein
MQAGKKPKKDIWDLLIELKQKNEG